MVTPRPLREPGTAPARRETSSLQKMKNSGNEAKKWLKTKEVTFFNAAHFAQFASKLAPNRAQKAPKNHILRKTNRSFPARWDAGTVTNSRLQESTARLPEWAPDTDWLEDPEVEYNPPRFARPSMVTMCGFGAC